MERSPFYREDLREGAKRLYVDEQKTTRETAEILGISRTRLGQILDELGIERRPRGRRPTRQQKTRRAA